MEPDSVTSTPVTTAGDTTDDAPQSVGAADKTQEARKPEATAKPPAAPATPIVVEHDVRRLDFRRRQPPVKAHIARVLITARGDYLVIAPGRQVTTADLLRKRIRSVCEVDVGQHVTHIDDWPPSRGDAFRFCASVDVHWRVVEPMRVVIDGLTDVRAALTPMISAHLSRITRTFAIEDCELAEYQANAQFAGLRIGAELGLETKTFVRLSMDTAISDGIKLNHRVGHYKDIIAAGDLSQFALRLAQKPDDVAEVVRMLIDERDRHRRDTVDLIANLIRSGAIERWEIDDQVRTVLQWLRETTNKVITGSDESRQFSLDSADQPTTVTDAPITQTNGSSPTP